MSLNQLRLTTKRHPVLYLCPFEYTQFDKFLKAESYIEDAPWSLTRVSDWKNLTAEIVNVRPDLIVCHVSTILSEFTTIAESISMLETLIKFTITDRKVPIAVSITKDTKIQTIKELQKNPVVGIVPTVIDFGLEETREAGRALLNGYTYWPRHILEKLPGSTKTVVKNTIKLTARQAEIADLIIKRGLSNKRIAKVLNITESTVKIHVSAILKSYGVRNRTQLVVMSNQ